MLRCFGRMTISGTGILWIVNRFLASLVRLDSFDVSSRRIRPRSICSRDCPSIISQIDSNEYPDCRTPRFSADHPFHFIPRDAYTFVPSNGFTRGKGKKKNSSSSSISFSRMENLSFRTYLSPNVSNLKLPIFFSVSSDSQGSSWEKRGCVRTKGARIRSTLLPRAVVSLFLFLSSHTNLEISKQGNIELVHLRKLLSRSLDEIEETKANRFPRYLRKGSSRSSARFVEIHGNELDSPRLLSRSWSPHGFP